MLEHWKSITIGLLLICLLDQSESRYLDSWLKFENFTHQNVINFVNNYENDFLTLINSSDVTTKCRSSLIDYKNGLINFELTSVKRLDSSGKWPSGVLAGTFTDLGSFDSCISLESSQYCLLYTNVPLFNETGYEGFMRPYEQQLFNFSSQPFQYFSKYIHFLRRMNITTGLCVPDDCSREELKHLVGKFFDKYNTGLIADVDLCYSKPETIVWRASEAIGLGLVVLIIFLNLIGSWSSEESLLSSFNWSANRRKLFTIDNSATYESLSFLDGIKVFTMFLVVLSHFQMGNMFNLYMESFRFIEIVTNPAFIPVYLAPYTVDLFLMVTGLLMGFYFFSGKRSLNVLSYVVGRWARFAALMGWIICLQFIFFGEHFRYYFGGPFWGDYSSVGSIVGSCERTWFTTLLLSQFWFDSSSDANVCLLFDWYLAADFMLSVMFLLVLFPYLKKYRKVSIFMSIFLIAVGLSFSGLGIHFLGIPTTWIASNFQRMPLIQYSFDFNLKPWPHMGSYFVGVTFGFIVSNPKLKLSKISLILVDFMSIVFIR
ncbi:uncharacterized protein LOC128386357 isoform X1 [Panonychus citri]|uniref:uncharacterized protein LOC128386357 isoform X1 n=1 Tax=Panonychus citri TaxID=50023 RepID=UPI002307C189|nr:uncharacterized protein LOC128386357 isoform X1 [Panonychus citri]